MKKQKKLMKAAEVWGAVCWAHGGGGGGRGGEKEGAGGIEEEKESGRNFGIQAHSCLRGCNLGHVAHKVF